MHEDVLEVLLSMLVIFRGRVQFLRIDIQFWRKREKRKYKMTNTNEKDKETRHALG